MSDGRQITDYRPNCLSTYLSAAGAQPRNSFDQRMFLVRNAESLIQKDRQRVLEVMGCTSCDAPYNPGTMLPEQAVQSCNLNTCSTIVTNPQGLGLGRNYSQNVGACGSKFDTAVVGSSQCCGTSNDYFSYYGVSGGR
jgi:hypothetical protein